jgi:hypothetical protein
VTSEHDKKKNRNHKNEGEDEFHKLWLLEFL